MQIPELASPSVSSIRPGSWAAWRIALRPTSLWIATIPVLAATCLAWSLAGAFDAATALIALAASVLMQVVTNLQNDVGFTERRTGNGVHVGMPRATANGWLTPREVKHAILVAIGMATLAALPMMLRFGWPIVLIGGASTLAAWSYMGGPRPIAYTPFGELAVFVFFGPVAVCGTYFLQTGEIVPAAWIAGAAIGALATAVLLVNNYRDRAYDVTTGRRTLAVVIGAAASVRLYATLELAPFALAALLAWVTGSAWLALPLLALPWALRLVRDFTRVSDGPQQNALLVRAVMLEVGFGMLLCAGALLNRWM
jgi:1,4-dihydroxy-2-naphthoate octaprenyltransferase